MRLDKYLLTKYPQYTRSKIQDLIKRNLVLVNNNPVNKTGYEVKKSDQIVVLEDLKYASRAGMKLEYAASKLNLNFNDLIVLDVGSSTGGFTDYSLINGAKLVYAYDVGTDQMIERLRNDERVILAEKTNILNVNPPQVDLILIDISFSSSKLILKHLKDKANQILLLIKPQFEVGKEYLKKGIVKDKKRVQMLLEEYRELANEYNFSNIELFPTNLPGKNGNLEYWLYLAK